MQQAVSVQAARRPWFLSLRARIAASAPTLTETALAAASAILLVLSFPNFDLWPLAWFGFVPLFVAVARRLECEQTSGSDRRRHSSQKPRRRQDACGPPARMRALPDAPAAGFQRSVGRSLSPFLLGWLTGAIFFYSTCYWLTYSMIHYGHLPAWLSYSLLLIPAAWIALFPALFCLLLARTVARWGRLALFAAPFLWVSLEWARLGVTGQLWNAIGYSQAYMPALIQTARWGGVYAVGFMIVLANSTLAYLWLERSKRAAVAAVLILSAIAGLIFLSQPPKVRSQRSEVRGQRSENPSEAAQVALPYGRATDTNPQSEIHNPQSVRGRATDTQVAPAIPYDLSTDTQAFVVAVQPNVPMELTGDLKETEALIQRHISLSSEALKTWETQQSNRGSASSETSRAPGQNTPQAARSGTGVPPVNHEAGGSGALVPPVNHAQDARAAIARLVIWPESPMNFTYTHDTELRQRIAEFTKKNRTSLLFNSLEPAPANGEHNSALMVDEEGRLVAQYDKIRLMPFGEYVPLPHWLPGASQVRALVGDFTPGQSYTLLPFGSLRAGVFICIESAYPSIARTFTDEGADVLVNISNDGYLGPTAVMRQHLANAIFRAVENDRPVLRVTNTGITALIDAHGKVVDATAGFQTAVRTWTVEHAGAKTFYTRRGDLFVGICAVIGLMVVTAAYFRSPFKKHSP